MAREIASDIEDVNSPVYLASDAEGQPIVALSKEGLPEDVRITSITDEGETLTVKGVDSEGVEHTHVVKSVLRRNMDIDQVAAEDELIQSAYLGHAPDSIKDPLVAQVATDINGEIADVDDLLEDVVVSGSFGQAGEGIGWVPVELKQQPNFWDRYYDSNTFSKKVNRKLKAIKDVRVR